MFASYPFNTYKINKGRVLLRGATPLLLQSLQRTCYIADVTLDDNNACVFAQFYYVNQCYDESGYIVLEVSPDLWATGIWRTHLLRSHVQRCNRQLPNQKAIYDVIENSVDPLTLTDGANEVKSFVQPNNIGAFGTSALNTAAVIFNASFVAASNVMGTEYIETTQNFVIPLLTIYNKLVEAANGDTDKLYIINHTHICELAAMVVSGIFAIPANALINADCKVNKAWIVTMYEFNYASDRQNWGYTFKFRTSITKNDAVEIFADAVVSNSTFAKRNRITFPTLPDFDYFVGSYADGFQSFRTPDGAFFEEQVMIDSSGLNVSIWQNENNKDITSAFEIPLLARAEATDGLQKIGMALTAVKDALNATKSVLSSKSEGAAYMSAASAVLSQASKLTNRAEARALNSTATGLQYMTMKRPTAYCGLDDITLRLLRWPIVIRRFKSLDDEEAHAYVEGARYNAYLNDFTQLQTYTHLGTANGNTRAGTFIQCDVVNFSEGLNANTEAYIETEFKRGIWLRVIS